MEEFEVKIDNKKIKIGILKVFSERVNVLKAYELIDKYNKNNREKIKIISPQIADHILLRTELWKKIFDKNTEYNYSDFFVDEFIAYGEIDTELGTEIEMKYEMGVESLEKAAKNRKEKLAAKALKQASQFIPSSVQFMPTKKIVLKVPKKYQKMKNVALIIESLGSENFVESKNGIEIKIDEKRIKTVEKFPTKVGAFDYDNNLIVPFGKVLKEEKEFNREDLRIIQYVDENKTIMSKVFVGPVTRMSIVKEKNRKYIGAFYSPENKAAVVVEFVG